VRRRLRIKTADWTRVLRLKQTPFISKIIYWLALVLAASGLVTPPIALLGGLIFGFTVTNPYPEGSKLAARILLQAAVVALGFGMNLHEILHAGRSGFVYTAGSIFSAMLLGLGLGALLHVERKPSFLISAGTAICGGSAIAAVGPIVGASADEMGVSMGVVFILNSVALFLFPFLGHILHMTQEQFGLWAALAIHDTSSVVGATAKYGATALAIGTTVKLARALWIIPLALMTAITLKSKARIQWPWFILLFCAAALLNTWLPGFSRTFGALNYLGKIGLTVTLFLIGTGLNRETVREVGHRPFLQGLVLWIVVGAGTLALILANWIRL
jgi:uncharacterized integral membrane protein (TIGR00698 family)